MFRREIKKQFNENITSKSFTFHYICLSFSEQANAKQVEEPQKHDFKNKSQISKTNSKTSSKAKISLKKVNSGDSYKSVNSQTSLTKTNSSGGSFQVNQQQKSTTSSQQQPQLRSLQTIMSNNDDDDDFQSDQEYKDTETLENEDKPVVTMKQSLMSVLNQNQDGIQKVQEKQVKNEEFDQDDFKTTSNKQNAEEGILKIAFFLTKHSITLREVFQEYLFDDEIDNKEFELLEIREFSEVTQTLMNLEESHVQAISIMLADHFMGDSFNFQFLEEIFKQMGYQTKEEVKIGGIDNKSKRILNRLNGHLQSNGNMSLKFLIIKILIIYQSLTDLVLINIQVEVIQSDNFFKLLKDKSIRKSVQVYQNLTNNFLLHKNLKDQLSVSKLQKYLLDISSSQVIQKFGTYKRQKTSKDERAGVVKKEMKRVQTQENYLTEKLSPINSEDESQDSPQKEFEEDRIIFTESSLNDNPKSQSNQIQPSGFKRMTTQKYETKNTQEQGKSLRTMNTLKFTSDNQRI